MRSFRTGQYLLAVAAAALLIPSAATAQSTPKLKASLGIGGSSTQIALLAMNVARTKGFFKEEGLELDATDLGSGAKGLQALVAGNVDMVAGVYEHTIRMHAKNVDIRSFVLHSIAPGIVVAVTKSFAPKFQSIKDLKGAKIGVSAPGSATHLLLNQLLVQHGLSPTDVSVIGIGNTTGAIAAVRTGGELQAIVNYDPVVTELEQSGDIKIVLDLRTLEATRAFYKSDFAFLSTYAYGDYIAKNPAVVQAMATGIVRALLWMRTAPPEEILAAVPESYWSGNRALYLGTIRKNLAGFSPTGLTAPDAAKTVYEGLLAYDKEVQNAKIDLAKTYENRFVAKALEAHGKK